MEKRFSLYQKNLYNAWITTSKLRDSVTIRRIRLLLLRQNLKLTTILKGQVRPMALFCSYIYIYIYADIWNLHDFLHVIWFWSGITCVPICLDIRIFLTGIIASSLLSIESFYVKLGCLEKGMHRSEPWNELTSNFGWEIHPMSVLISVQPRT